MRLKPSHAAKSGVGEHTARESESAQCVRTGRERGELPPPSLAPEPQGSGASCFLGGSRTLQGISSLGAGKKPPPGDERSPATFSPPQPAGGVSISRRAPMSLKRWSPTSGRAEPARSAGSTKLTNYVSDGSGIVCHCDSADQQSAGQQSDEAIDLAPTPKTARTWRAARCRRQMPERR